MSKGVAPMMEKAFFPSFRQEILDYSNEPRNGDDCTPILWLETSPSMDFPLKWICISLSCFHRIPKTILSESRDKVAPLFLKKEFINPHFRATECQQNLI